MLPLRSQRLSYAVEDKHSLCSIGAAMYECVDFEGASCMQPLPLLLASLLQLFCLHVFCTMVLVWLAHTLSLF